MLAVSTYIPYLDYQKGKNLRTKFNALCHMFSSLLRFSVISIMQHISLLTCQFVIPPLSCCSKLQNYLNRDIALYFSLTVCVYKHRTVYSKDEYSEELVPFPFVVQDYTYCARNTVKYYSKQIVVKNFAK